MITWFLLERTANMNKKGVALYFVLAVLLVVVILANIVLSFITSQSKLTSHQIKRVQAIYAAQAGVNYAIEQLRLNNTVWITDTVNPKYFRICGPLFNISNGAICASPNLTEESFPNAVNFVEINISALNTTTNNRNVSATVNYTEFN